MAESSGMVLFSHPGSIPRGSHGDRLLQPVLQDLPSGAMSGAGGERLRSPGRGTGIVLNSHICFPGQGTM